MIIKEIEARSGMTRANIRFYETEGLLSPERGDNGYRNYSEDDLEVLKRIKLLRTLHISLEEIKALHTGERNLLEALDEHISKLELDKEELECSQEVCRAMRNDRVAYATLDAQPYLDAVERGLNKPAPELAADVLPKVKAQWPRFLARMLDWALYTTVLDVFRVFVLDVNLLNQNNGEDLLMAIMGIVLTFAIEPVLLSTWGTTVGKWIFGLRVTDNMGNKLCYQDALSRTFSVFWHGEGFDIPIYHLYRNWKSYEACENGETLDWEWDSNLVQKDDKIWRFWAFAGVWLLLVFGVTPITVKITALPENSGDITVAEFCENYNRYAEYYDIGNGSILDENGKWVEKETGNVAVVVISYEPKPLYEFTEENGVMTGMSFSVKRAASEWIEGYSTEMMLAIMSFVQAQEGYGAFSDELDEVIKQLVENPFEDFNYEKYGISIVCDQEYSGYHYGEGAGMLISQDGVLNTYSITFEMKKLQQEEK